MRKTKTTFKDAFGEIPSKPSDFVLYTKIKTETICKNGSEKYGAKSTCEYSCNGGKKWIQVTFSGDSKADSHEKLMNFLSNNGNDFIKQVNKKIS